MNTSGALGLYIFGKLRAIFYLTLFKIYYLVCEVEYVSERIILETVLNYRVTKLYTKPVKDSIWFISSIL